MPSLSMEPCFFSVHFIIKTCQFLIHQETTQEKAGPSTVPSAVESSSVKSSKSVKSFSEYKTAKGKHWYSKVKGGKAKGGKAKGTKTSAADQEVLIYIGLLEWNEKKRKEGGTADFKFCEVFTCSPEG